MTRLGGPNVVIRRRTHWSTLLAATLAVASASPLALAQGLDSAEPIRLPKDDAVEAKRTPKELMRAGVAEYRKKNWEGARAEFAKAWRMQPHTEIAAALADVEMKLGRYREAAERWEYYLNYQPPDRDEAQAQLAECRRHIGSVRLQVDPPGAKVLLNGAAINPAAVDGSIWLDPGRHTLVARHDGRSSIEHKLQIIAGQEQAVQLTVLLTPAVGPIATANKPIPAAPPTPPHEDGGVEARTVFLLGGASLTIGAAVVGVIQTLKSNAADDRRVALLREVRQEVPASVPGDGLCAPRPDLPAKCAEIAFRSKEADDAQNLATVGFIASGALGVATVATYLLWPDAQRTAEQAGLVIAPLDVARSRGVQVRVSF